MHPLVLTGLWPLMTMTAGDPEVVVALIDGPVADHPDLTRRNIRAVRGRSSVCSDADSLACRHGTFIAGILNARRGSRAPAICPGCTLLLRPIFLECEPSDPDTATAFPVELANAVIECIDQGARIINLSIEIIEPCPESDAELTRALDHAADKDVVVVAAAGNQGITGGSVLTRHPWVIPVAACDLQGRTAAYSNRTGSINKKGVMAPGEKVNSIVSNGQASILTGTSIAVPFVAGAIALMWSLRPGSFGFEIRTSLLRSCLRSHRSHVPPLLNACGAWDLLQKLDPSRQNRPLEAA